MALLSSMLHGCYYHGQVVKHINPNGSSCLSWHPVSSIVNNVRNKSPECIAKINLSELVV